MNGLAGILAAWLLSMGSACAGYLPQSTQFLRPDTVITFGEVKYSVRGIEPCQIGSDHDCINLTPGTMAYGYMYPVGSKNDAVRGIMIITGTKEKPIISLSNLMYPDGKEKSFSPALVGTIGDRSNER